MQNRAPALVKRASRLADPQDGLTAVVALRRELETLEVAQVRHALAEGWSWSRIAEALGVSKQAAHKKHGTPRPAPNRPGGDEGRRLTITGQARGVVELAREEARRLGEASVEPQHLLLGLLRSGDGPAWVALRRAGVHLPAARHDLTAARTKEADTDEHALPRGRPAVSPAARSSFEQSLREAVARNDDHLGPEHILLALICDHDGATAQTLGRLGVSLGRLHRQLERAIKAAPAVESQTEAPGSP